ncbi:hypothetical protein EJB05_41921, partial [Eragrostis curvula]
MPPLGNGPDDVNSSLATDIVLGVGGLLFIIAVGYLLFSILRDKKRREASLRRIKPTKFVREEMVEAPEDAQCPVCLTDYDDCEILGELPCGHRYHGSCVERWLRVSDHLTCPTCRASV